MGTGSHPRTRHGRFLHRLGAVLRFYNDGFRSMTVGRTLWVVILVKTFVLFGVLKLFFFPDFLHTRFATDADRSQYVLEQITTTPGDTNPNDQGDPHD